MSNNRFEFSRSLIGYKRRQVNKYIRRLTMKNDMEVKEIKESISILAEKNEMLQKKLAELKYQIDDEFEQQREVEVEFECNEFENEAAAYIEPTTCEDLEPEDLHENEEIRGQGDCKFIHEIENDIQYADTKNEISNDDVEALENKTTDKVSVSKIDILPENHGGPRHKASSFWEYEFDELFTEKAVDFEEEPGSTGIRFENQERDTNRKKQPDASSSKENEAENDTNIKKEEEESNQMESKELENRIKDIRSKYLIDKIVGEDLMDRQGNVLAKKGSTITENLIRMAGREGKLAELIVNMVLPGTSE